MEPEDTRRFVKDRTGNVPDTTKSEVKYSRYHIVVNPVKFINKEDSPELYDRYKSRMIDMASFLLRDEVIKSYLRFNPVNTRTGFGTWRSDEYPDQWHLDRIRYITNKEAAIEDSKETTKSKGVRVHSHIIYDIVHSGNINLDREKIRELAAVFFSEWVNPKAIYVHTKSTNSANFFLDYIQKNKEWSGDDYSEGPPSSGVDT